MPSTGVLWRAQSEAAVTYARRGEAGTERSGAKCVREIQEGAASAARTERSGVDGPLRRGGGMNEADDEAARRRGALQVIDGTPDRARSVRKWRRPRRRASGHFRRSLPAKAATRSESRSKSRKRQMPGSRWVTYRAISRLITPVPIRPSDSDRGIALPSRVLAASAALAAVR